MRRPGAILIGSIALGIVLLVGVGLQGAARFSGIRWTPDFSRPTVRPQEQRSSAPFATATPTAKAAPHSASQFDFSLILWSIGALVVLIAAYFLVRWLLRRPPRQTEALHDVALNVAEQPTQEPASLQPDAPVLRRGFRQAIDALESEREPHDAIVKAWIGLQNAAAESGIRRRNSETPTEFTRRILARAPSDQPAVETLLRLYLRVRFGDHPAVASDVAQVRQSLETLAVSWDAAADAAHVSESTWARRQ